VSDLEIRMAQLSARFAARAADERAALNQRVTAGDRAGVQDRAHKLAGIAAMFGHPDVGEAALALELAAEAGDPIGPAAARLDTLLAAIG
jgi:HPt (histidine-containing phosphotransfer) domain-containing protein